MLVTLERDGEPVDAVVQATKHGFVFVLDRETGTGERYRLHQMTGRTVFQHDGVPCNRPPWGLLVVGPDQQAGLHQLPEPVAQHARRHSVAAGLEIAEAGGTAKDARPPSG